MHSLQLNRIIKSWAILAILVLLLDCGGGGGGGGDNDNSNGQPISGAGTGAGGVPIFWLALGAPGTNSGASSVQATSDGGYIAAGGQENAVYLVKIDAQAPNSGIRPSAAATRLSRTQPIASGGRKTGATSLPAFTAAASGARKPTPSILSGPMQTEMPYPAGPKPMRVHPRITMGLMRCWKARINRTTRTALFLWDHRPIIKPI